MSFSTNFQLNFISKVRLTTPGTATFHDYTEMSYIISGSCKYMIGDTTFELNEGDYFFIRPGQLHHCTELSGNEPLELFAAAFSELPIPPGHLPVHHTSIGVRPKLDELIQVMQQENCSRQPYYKIKLLSCMADFAVALLRDELPDTSVPDNSSSQSLTHKEQQIQQQALDYIKKHFTEPIRLETIARSVPVSVSYLNKLFQKTLHTAPMQYVIYLRLKKAVSIFDNTPSISVRETAFRCGYSDPYHFSRLFRKHVGVTPTEYIAGKRAKKF